MSDTITTKKGKPVSSPFTAMPAITPRLYLAGCVLTGLSSLEKANLGIPDNVARICLTLADAILERDNNDNNA